MTGALIVAIVALAVAVVAYAPEAHACGGCFIPPAQTESTVVTAHRMAVSVSSERSILWDQIEYSGNPAEFAWVLPVKQGAVIETGSDAFFESLEVATAATVISPTLFCGTGGGGGPGFFCGMPLAESQAQLDGEQPTSVTVLHKGTVGPYETVTLRSNNGDALGTWLSANSYGVDPSVAPVIQQYVDEEFDFIAIKLRPGEGVDAMTPVRVVTPGTAFSFPLRMVAAGTGAQVGITLFVIGEGRWSVQNGTMVTVQEADVEWDFATSSSNFRSLRDSALQANDGNAWLTAHARPDSLFGQRDDPAIYGAKITFTIADGSSALNIAEAFALQGKANQETDDTTTCMETFRGIAGNPGRVVDLCDAQNVCRPPLEDEIDARSLRCGRLDDLSAALVGMRPDSVWVTRLEANLPRTALAQDLSLTAAPNQTMQDNFIYPTKGKNPPTNCSVGGASNQFATATPQRGTEQFAGLVAMLGPLVVGMTLLRRSSRRPRS